jgi:3-hydroxybutyryl-CoA dehydratase
MTSRSNLFSTDFDSLSVGDTFKTRGRTITESDVCSFASLTGDMHPQHTDAQWASESVFGERIAHGMLVLSYAVGLVPLDPDRIVALRRVRDAVFKQPARFGDTITVEGSVDRLDAIDERVGLVSCVWKIVNDSQKTLIRANVEVLWRRSGSFDPPPGGPAEDADQVDPAQDTSGVVPL